jgi:hypothetical protein
MALETYIYEAIDLIIDESDDVYLMEINDKGFGMYAIEQLAERARWAGQSALGASILDGLCEAIKEFYYRKKNEEPKKLGIIYDRKKPRPLIELREIAKRAINHGMDAKIFAPDEAAIMNNKVVIGDFTPEILYRWLYNFPLPSIEQPVVNDLRISYISDKWKTYQALKGKVRQPVTSYAGNIEKACQQVKRYQEEGKNCIVKPMIGHGGGGIMIIKSHEDVKVAISKEEERFGEGWFSRIKPFVVQELINSKKFRSSDGEEYAFDLRLIALDGKIAGIHGRRAPVPFQEGMGESLISNISSGGRHICALEGGNQNVSWVPIGEGIVKLGETNVP